MIPANNSIAVQRKLLKAYLQAYGRITTIDARWELNILAPAARVFELRHNEGLNILTRWRTETTYHGISHRVADYILLPGIYQGVSYEG